MTENEIKAQVQEICEQRDNEFKHLEEWSRKLRDDKAKLLEQKREIEDKVGGVNVQLRSIKTRQGEIEQTYRKKIASLKAQYATLYTPHQVALKLSAKVLSFALGQQGFNGVIKDAEGNDWYIGIQDNNNN